MATTRTKTRAGTTTRSPVIRNLRKVKTLLFLEMRQETENPSAFAGEIATATGGNARSLYILLQRWFQWGLIECLPSTPYSYRIAPEGLRYLSRIGNWFFSGYYSKKRKKRMPGYRGKAEDLKREIAIASKAVFWWRYFAGDHWERERDKRECERLGRESTKGVVYCLMAPFKKASDLVKQEGSEGRGIRWGKGNLLVMKFEDALSAYQFLPEWGFVKDRRKEEVGQAIVDAKIGMVWAKE